jgi:hypothetical protein
MTPIIIYRIIVKKFREKTLSITPLKIQKGDGKQTSSKQKSFEILTNILQNSVRRKPAVYYTIWCRNNSAWSISPPLRS